MIELKDATQFIEKFEKGYGKKICRVPFMLSDKRQVALLVCRCGNRYVSLAYLSLGVVETEFRISGNDNKTNSYISDGVVDIDVRNFDLIKFPKNWEVRDVLQYGDHAYKDKVVFEYDLTQENFDYPSDIKRKIRKSSENIQVKYFENPSSKEMDDFYYAYSKRMHKIGVPPASKKDILRKINLGICLIFVAYNNEKPAGAATLDKFSEDYFENYYFATLSQYNHFYTAYALHSAMIEYSINNNAKTYSFGRSTRDSSVYKFKKHWKANEIQLFWSQSSEIKSVRNNKWFFNLWKKLPYRLTITLGPYIHRRIY